MKKEVESLFELMTARCGSHRARPLRPTSAEVVSHVLTRANARRRLFEDGEDSAGQPGIDSRPTTVRFG